jgi:hypothetical protein
VGLSTVLKAGGELVGAGINMYSANKAKQAQVAALGNAIQEQQRQYDLTRSDFAPWREVGTDAINRLRSVLQLGEQPEGTPRYSLEDDPILQSSMQFGIGEGTKALSRMARAKGMFNSGATAKALARYTTDYTNTKQNEAFGRLTGLADVGQRATGSVANAGQNTSNNISEYMIGQGNARGAAAIAQGNAFSGAISGIGNAAQRYLLGTA